MEPNPAISLVHAATARQVDLSLYQCGREACAPGHAYGPAVRDHYLVHVVESGCGRFVSGGATYPVTAGQGFLIRPMERTFYQADDRDPWTYIWVGFHGTRVLPLLSRAGLRRGRPVFPADPAAVRSILEAWQATPDDDTAAMGHLYLFLASLVRTGRPERPRRSDDDGAALVERAVRFLQGAYSNPVRIGALASRLGIDRTSLFRLFRKHLGMSPQAYLHRFRMERADVLLQETDLPIAEIACSVGLESQAHFTRAFRRHRGCTPGAFRKDRA